MKLYELIEVLNPEVTFIVKEEHSTNNLFDSDKSSRMLPEEYGKLKEISNRIVSSVGMKEDDNPITICVKVELPTITDSQN